MKSTQRNAATHRRRALEDRIATIISTQHGLITRAQLIECGLSGDSIGRRVACGTLRVHHRGVYGVGLPMPPRAPMMAAVLACGPGAILSHRSAAVLFDIVSTASVTTIDVSIPSTSRRTHAGVRVHRVARLDSDEFTVHDGLPTTTALRTIADLAGVLAERDLERAVARAERNGLVAPEELSSMAKRYRGRRGSSRLATILGRAGGPLLTRSEAEARFLALLRRARLPMPRANTPLAGYEIDFYWPEHGLAVEVDGYRYHASRASFEGDRKRSAHLSSLGLQVVHLTWRQIVDDEIATIAQLAQALARSRRPRAADLPLARPVSLD